MSSYLTVQNLAAEIWADLNEPTSISLSSIETKITSTGALGKLDILINKNHYIDYDYTLSGRCFEPDLTSNEQAIYKQQYLSEFYYKAATNIFMFSDGQTAGSWTTMREGDTSITRANPVEIAKYYGVLAKESNIILDKLVDSYKMNNSNSISVDYLTIDTNKK